MNSLLLVTLVIICLIGGFILFKWVKPYFIRYNTTIFITGELGSGKTLTAVKLARVLIIKARKKVAFYNKIKMPIKNWFIKRHNKKYTNDQKQLLNKKRKPQLITNIPVNFTKGIFTSKREWSVKLTPEMILLLEKIPEYSVVLIDELPQMVNQFNWDLPLVQNNINEFITFYRHYVGGHILFTSQASNDVVVQIRRKCNQAIWCYNMKKHLFGLFYTIRMADMMLNDNIQSMSTTYIEDNTKVHYGLFPKKNTYDTRCFSERYKNAYLDPVNWNRWKNIKTNEIIRIEPYTSPIDDKTTETQKKTFYNKVQTLKTTNRKEKKDNEKETKQQA